MQNPSLVAQGLTATTVKHGLDDRLRRQGSLPLHEVLRIGREAGEGWRQRTRGR